MLRNDLSESITLNGTWDFSLGSSSQETQIQVPGCWEAQGFSKFAEGPAYYQREVTIPEEWVGYQILGEFDAVSYACEIFLNGKKVGQHQGLWTPFLIDLSPEIRPGEVNTIALTVYKPGERFPMRSTLAGFLPDVATTFGGIWQTARIRALQVGIDDLEIRTDFQGGRLHISCQSVVFDRTIQNGRWEIHVFSGEDLITKESYPHFDQGRLDTTLTVDDPIFWSPENPHLYSVQIKLLDQDTTAAQISERFGFRRMAAEGDQLIFNDQSFLGRGILSWGWDPDQIAPAYSPEQAREEMRRVRQLGFNLIKLCLFIPNQVYFDIADEEGMLLWLELPLWLPEITPELRETIVREYAEMTKLACNHPAVVLYSLGCELSRVVDSELLKGLSGTVRDRVDDVLVCDNSGSGESYGGLAYDFSDFTDYHPYCDIHYFEALLDNWRRDWRPPRPWIFGEFCDSDTFRDIDEIIAKGGGEEPWWMTAENPVTRWRPESLALLEYHDRLKKAQTGFSPQELVAISYAQSLVERKYTLEALRRRRGMGGYVITGLRDTPISTSGIWDDLNRAKWTPTDLLPINGDAVLTLDVPRKRRWHHGGDRPDRVDVYNHLSGSTVRWNVIFFYTGSKKTLESPLNWTLVDDQNKVIQSGSEEIRIKLTPGIPQHLKAILCNLPIVDKGIQHRLEISIPKFDPLITNNWPMWIYPDNTDTQINLTFYDPANLLDELGEWPAEVPRAKGAKDISRDNVLLTTLLNDELIDFVERGGRLILLQNGQGPLPSGRCPFWRESILLFPRHPLWDSFPQNGYADMQFFGLASDTAFESHRLLDCLPGARNLRPIMRRLDAREFIMSEYLFEVEIGLGRLMGCTLRLAGGAGVQPYGLKRNIVGSALLWSMINYFDKRQEFLNTLDRSEL